MRPVKRWARLALWAGFGALGSPACSLGQGSGTVSGVLDVPACWSGPFDLHPDFFAAVPSVSGGLQTGSDAVLIRVQNGGDNETFSDGLSILVDDAGEVRGDPSSNGMSRPSLLGLPLIVALPVGVAPPGVPLTSAASGSIVHASLFLDRTCRTQNVALYASDSVTLHPDGTCNPSEGGDPVVSCAASPVAIASDGGAQASATTALGDASADGSTDGSSGPAPIGQSTITFQSLFDGNPEESDAAQRLTQANFEFYLVDPREMCPGGLGPPPPCRGHITGSFRFYFDRGSPAQPFP